MKKDKSSHGFHGYHGLLSFRNGVVHIICIIREIRGCFVETNLGSQFSDLKPVMGEVR